MSSVANELLSLIEIKPNTFDGCLHFLGRHSECMLTMIAMKQHKALHQHPLNCNEQAAWRMKESIA